MRAACFPFWGRGPLERQPPRYLVPVVPGRGHRPDGEWTGVAPCAEPFVGLSEVEAVEGRAFRPSQLFPRCWTRQPEVCSLSERDQRAVSGALTRCLQCWGSH